MKLKIDLEECLRDSPNFRSYLEGEEANIENLEQRLDKVIKQCGLMIDTGKTYVGQQSLFANSLWELSAQFREDPDVAMALKKLIHAFQEMNKFHTILLDQASRTVLKNLTSFVKTEVRGVRDQRNYFEKMSGELDAVVVRNSVVARARVNEAQEAQDVLAATTDAFRHTALDYVRSLAITRHKQRHEILATLLSYMHACSTYYHQGSDLCQDLDGFLKTLAEDVVEMRCETDSVDKELENRHELVRSCGEVPRCTSNDPQTPLRDVPRMQGYLFKRTSNAFKTWNRRWFYLLDRQLVYKKRSGEDNATVMEEDLRLCNVKPLHDAERRFCFEVVSPSKSHILQADSAELLEAWVTALQRGIGAAFHHTYPAQGQSPKPHDNPAVPPERPRPKAYEQLLLIPGNETCGDCGDVEPRWASISLGVTLCIACSGVHRSLGVQLSKVRSLTLDSWEPETLKLVAQLGNRIVNSIYLAKEPPPDLVPATPRCSDAIRDAWIRAKYEQRLMVRQLRPEPPVSHRTSRATDVRARKWSVRKLRRRPRSGTRPRSRHRSTSGEKQDAERSEKDNMETVCVTTDILVIGGDLEVPLPEGVALEDEQDSTGGEDEDGESEVMLDGCEDMSELHPDLVLYRAAAAHNLPVMCAALALRADPSWRNPRDKYRTPLHQAILSSKRRATNTEKQDAERSEKHDTDTISVTTDILVIGGDLEAPLPEGVALEDEQDSTGGEEDGESEVMLDGCEDMSELHPDLVLYRAAAAHNLPVMCAALALRADPSWRNPRDKSRTPLHQAILSGSVMSCAYLIVNGAGVNVTDSGGESALHLATQLGHTAQVCLLLKHRADQHLADAQGRQPLHIAVENANADIVTLLRLGRLNEEMKQEESGVSEDDTFRAVVRDFSHLACSHPERLMPPPPP